MRIILSPIRSDEPLTAYKVGDTLVVNGEVFDFSPLTEGCVLPASSINSKWFCGDVTRVNGELEITLLLPHGPNAPYETRFPSSIIVTTDGDIQLPPYNGGTVYE